MARFHQSPLLPKNDPHIYFANITLYMTESDIYLSYDMVVIPFQSQERNTTMSYQCELLDRTEQPVLSVRARGAVKDLPAIMGRSYGAIGAYLGRMGQMPAGAPFVAYHNQDMQNLDLEIGFPVAKHLPGQGEIQSGKMPAGKAASCLHIGPYDKIKPAYQALGQWMQSKGYQGTGVCYEIYLNDPQQTPPEQLQTQILFPIL
jgi:effector-binding domain-containing protein